jgi:hypothetical protein
MFYNKNLSFFHKHRILIIRQTIIRLHSRAAFKSS